MRKTLALGLVLAACNRERDRTEAYGSDLEGDVSQCVAVTLAACTPPPERRDGLAIGKAADVVAAYRESLALQEKCAADPQCGEITPPTSEARRHLAPSDVASLETSERSFRTWAEGAKGSAARAEVASAIGAGIATLDRATKLLTVCRKTGSALDEPPALKALEQSHEAFRRDLRKVRSKQ